METAAVEPGPGQNLNDLQNYLVHFGKEIETVTQPTSEQLQDISLIQPASENVPESDSTASIIQLPTSKPEQTGGPQFTSGFYTEQPIIATSLGASVQELSGMSSSISVTGSQNIDSGSSTINTEADQCESEPKQQEESDALENYNDYIASLTGEKMDGEELTVEPVTLAQELAVNSMMEGLVAQTSAGKMIRIVSVGKDGQMQLVGEDMPAGINIANLQLKQEPQSELDNIGGMDSKQSDVIDGTDPVAVLASVATNTSSVNQIQNACRGDVNDPQLVALQNSADSSQPQLVAVQGGSGESMQIIGADSFSGQGNQMMLNSFQTVTIVPSDVNQESGIVSYVLIVSPDGDKEGSEKHISLDMAGYDLKDEALREVTEEIVQEDGTTHRVLKISPQNFFPGSQTQLVCNICNYTSPKRYLLLRHMKTHSEDRPYKCNICERGFKTLASLTNHVNTHTGTRPHKCKDCESSFTTSGELVRHIRYRHTFEKPHKCPECDYASVELSKLKRHIRMHTGERPYQCQLCSYASPDTYKLKRHLRIHTGEKPYECDLCHARFTQSNSLKAHKLIHSGDKPIFQCELCPTTCGRKTDLKIHYQKLHTSEHPLLCRKCGQNFPDRYTYKLHIKQHDGEKCFKCEECDYAALSQRHLESHMLVHSGEKPFECNGCDQTFRQKQLLRRHQNLHHTPDYVKPPPKAKCYNCSECDKTFAHRGYLARHLESHGKHVTFSESEEEETDVNDLPTISAQHVLESNLMQEWRDGKLGNSPQVVIVHPDGRVEEVTPKLQAPPDRTVDDLLEAMSAHTSGKQDGSEEEKKQALEGAKSQKSDEDEESDIGRNARFKEAELGPAGKQGSYDLVMEGVDPDQSAVVSGSVQEQGGQQKQTQTRAEQVVKGTEHCQMKEAGTQATIDSDSEDDSFRPVILSCRTVSSFEKKAKALSGDKNITVDNRNQTEVGISNVANSDVSKENVISAASVKGNTSTLNFNNGSKCAAVVASDTSFKLETIAQSTSYSPVKEADAITNIMNAQMDTIQPGSSSTVSVASGNMSSSAPVSIGSSNPSASCVFSNIESGQVVQVSSSVSPLCSQSDPAVLGSLNTSKSVRKTVDSNSAMTCVPDCSSSVSASRVSKSAVTVTVGSSADTKVSSAALLKQQGNMATILKSQSPDRLTRSMKRKEIELGASPAKRTRRATTADSK